jgi:hypothetical protein
MSRSSPTMSLCSLCRSIPFEALTCLPECYQRKPNTFKKNSPASLYFFVLKIPSPPLEPLGFPHHNSLEILAASAETCGLCDFLHSSLNAFLTAFSKAENEPSFSHYTQRRLGISSDFQLFLTRRSNGGDGFLVLLLAPPEERLYVLGAVGLCVEDSR